MKKLLLASLLSVTSNTFLLTEAVASTQMQPEPTTQELVKRMTYISDFKNMARNMLHTKLNKAKYSESINNSAINQLNSFLESDEFEGKLVEIYVKAFTHAEMIEIVKFYESDAGKKCISSMPQISVEIAELMATSVTKLSM